MNRLFSGRKIHIVTAILLILFYVSLGIFIWAWTETHGSNLKTLNPKEWARIMTFATASMLGIAIFGILVFASGIYYFAKINDASEYYKTFNKITGITLLLGGCGIALPFTLYLFFNE